MVDGNTDQMQRSVKLWSKVSTTNEGSSKLAAIKAMDPLNMLSLVSFILVVLQRFAAM